MKLEYDGDFWVQRYDVFLFLLIIYFSVAKLTFDNTIVTPDASEHQKCSKSAIARRGKEAVMIM